MLGELSLSLKEAAMLYQPNRHDKRRIEIIPRLSIYEGRGN